MIKQKMFIFFYRNGKISKEELIVNIDANASHNSNILLTHEQIDTFKDDDNNHYFRKYVGTIIPLKTKDMLICTSQYEMTFIMWSFEDKCNDFKELVYERFEKAIANFQKTINAMKKEMENIEIVQPN